MNKFDVLSCDMEDLQLFMSSDGINEKAFRAKQIFTWLHEKNVTTFEEMTNLPKSLRDKLTDKAEISGAEIYKKYNSIQDNTTKYLFSLGKNNIIIESVLMNYDYGNTVCISSQAGCNMGCNFCASTIGGLIRNLTTGEMLSQVYEIKKDSNAKISGIVIMGGGEPLQNFANVIKFLKIVNSSDALNIGMRHITLSTCGLVPEIRLLAEFNFQLTLAVSLHAPNDTIRKSIMPIANKYNMNELLSACDYYCNTTKRRITFEYALIQNVNDKPEHAYQLSTILKGRLCHVNLIPVNEIKERDFKSSTKENAEKFAQILNKRGIVTTIRRKLGSDIDAACGQLRLFSITKD